MRLRARRATRRDYARAIRYGISYYILARSVAIEAYARSPARARDENKIARSPVRPFVRASARGAAARAR